MSNDTMPANPILILKPEPNTVVFCADGEPYLTIGPDDVPPDVIERFQSWVKNNTPPVTPTVPKHLVDALIEAIGNSRGGACPTCYAISGGGEYHDDDCVNGNAIAAMKEKVDE
jgi:hypothetical protein